MDDTQLLRTYIENGSEQAFERVVERHIQLVHSAALRQCDGDTRRAEEVTQMVFTDLARKAERLKNHPLLIGWLHRSTRLASNNLRRSEQRRRQLEQAFACDNALSSTAEPPVDWEQIRPWIDEALDKLNQSEREAVLLRFFENLSFDEIGRLLGIADNTARMRVSRALTKLHSSLSRKGLRSSWAALGLALGAHSVGAVPPGLATSVARTSFAQAGTTTGAALAGGLFLMSKFQIGLLSILTLGLGLGAFFSHNQAKALAAKESQLQATLAGIEAQIAETEAAKTKLGQTLTELRTKTTPPPSPVLAQRFELDKIIRKGELDYDYGYLFKKLRLSRDKVNELKGLLVDRNQAIFDARKLVELSGMGDLLPSEAKSVFEDATAGVDDRIRKLLGEDGLAYLHFYIESASWRQLQLFWSQNQEESLPSFAQMDEIDARSAKLVGLFKTECPDFEDEVFWNYRYRPLPESFVEKATEILGTNYREYVIETSEHQTVRQKMNDIARGAAAQGKLRLSKSSSRAYGVPYKVRKPRRPSPQPE